MRVFVLVTGAVSLLVMAGCGASGAGGSGHGSFSTNLYTSIMIADFNGDGNLDIATCYTVVSNGSNADHGTVQVFLQDTSHPGRFLAPANYSVGDDPFTIAVGDLNGDGKPDIVTANGLSDPSVSGLSVLLQSGNGQFLPAASYSTGNLVNSVAIGDVNGDGRPDLVVADSGGISILLQNPASPGTFTAGSKLNVPGGAGWSVAVSDVNEDGVPDLVVVNGVNVLVFLGNAAAPGSFLAPVSYSAGQQPVYVAVADLNGDGKPDIAVADLGAGGSTTTGVHVLLQDPSSPGTFEAATDYTNGSGSTELAIADVDGDGTPDIAAAASPNVSILFGSIASPGGFPTINNYPGNPGQTGFGQVPPQVLWVAIGDMNGDGKPDLIFADDTGVSIRFQDPANPGKFFSATVVVSSP